MIQIRKAVQWFAEQMEKELKANDYKGGWDSCSEEYLLNRLKEELNELELSPIVDIDMYISECADVANFAMMLADNAKNSQESEADNGLH
jgi:hypothetical protein